MCIQPACQLSLSIRFWGSDNALSLCSPLSTHLPVCSSGTFLVLVACPLLTTHRFGTKPRRPLLHLNKVRLRRFWMPDIVTCNSAPAEPALVDPEILTTPRGISSLTFYFTPTLPCRYTVHGTRRICEKDKKKTMERDIPYSADPANGYHPLPMSL